MEVHGSEISRALGEAVAAAVHDKAADPVEFLRDYFAKASKHAGASVAEERRTRELDHCSSCWNRSAERALLEQRVSSSKNSVRNFDDDFHCSAKDIDVCTEPLPRCSLINGGREGPGVCQAVGHEEPINTTPIEFVEQHTTPRPTLSPRRCLSSQWIKGSRCSPPSSRFPTT